ncbi:hypothetical protein [Bacillus atrophaeus]|uniref:hypothetical protein n=1 Tax=Bacillus atrophaeus TaxID=1452 RepID=UPI00227FC7F6|nr:hypothetical protein [Bacillus atrophaeus]MCY9166758.1 hypothetical protein [Bacillus atrophaeus]
MKETRWIYLVLKKAAHFNVEGLRKLKLKNGWFGEGSEAYIYKNVIFVLDETLLGKCSNIYLTEYQYNNDEDYKINAFEVFGPVRDYTWTGKEYDWLYKGTKWIRPIINYIGTLQLNADLIESKVNSAAKIEKLKQEKDKLDKFNKMFS